MTKVAQADIENALSTYIDPYTGQDLVTGKAINKIDIQGSEVNVLLQLGYPAEGFHEQLSEGIKDKLRDVPAVEQVGVKIATKIKIHAVQKSLKPLANIKNIIAIASGKGGVGKSTTAVNLALALAADGASIGILDADIYGPSMPLMLGLSGKPESKDNKTMEPKVAYGIQTNSIGYLIEEDTPMIWRGPMVTSALQQLLNDTNWGELDYLIIDLPPGTGDIQLTLAQSVPVSGAVIVTTPQDVALLDAQKGLKMFEKVDIPVLGVIENMSTHICSNCQHEEPIFGSGGGAKMAEKYKVKLLGSLPLDINIRSRADSGHPTVIADPDSAATQSYKEIARNMSAKLAISRKDFSRKFNIVVEKG